MSEVQVTALLLAFNGILCITAAVFYGSLSAAVAACIFSWILNSFVRRAMAGAYS